MWHQKVERLGYECFDLASISHDGDVTCKLLGSKMGNPIYQRLFNSKVQAVRLVVLISVPETNPQAIVLSYG